jgi:hypothetical protein
MCILSTVSLSVRSRFTYVDILAAIPPRLHDFREAIQYTYQESNGEPFSICAITNPLFSNTTLSILYRKGKMCMDIIPIGWHRFWIKDFFTYQELVASISPPWTACWVLFWGNSGNGIFWSGIPHSEEKNSRNDSSNEF